jgi:hypothetical protein
MSAVFAFVEGFYNPRRCHSSIDYLSPIDDERRPQETAVKSDATLGRNLRSHSCSDIVSSLLRENNKTGGI